MKGAQSEEKSSTVGQSQRGEEKNAPGQKPKGMSSENEGAKAGKDMKTEGREGQKSNMNAQQKGTESKSQTTTESQTGRSSQTGQTQPGQAGQTTTTTGQAGAGGKLSSEQRTKITSVIRNERVESVNNVDFNISVGTRVPRERVHLYPLPQEVVTIYPEWRGYEFIRVRNQIVVVNPQTLEIVEVIEG